jgi:hypothetical protein
MPADTGGAAAKREQEEVDWAGNGGDDRERTKDRRKTAERPNISEWRAGASMHY